MAQILYNIFSCRLKLLLKQIEPITFTNAVKRVFVLNFMWRISTSYGADNVSLLFENSVINWFDYLKRKAARIDNGQQEERLWR